MTKAEMDLKCEMHRNLACGYLWASLGEFDKAHAIVADLRLFGYDSQAAELEADIDSMERNL